MLTRILATLALGGLAAPAAARSIADQPDVTTAKARSAALFHVNTHDFFTMARDQNLALGFIPGILPAVAGVPLTLDGATIASVGVSGDKDDAEQALADATVARFR